MTKETLKNIRLVVSTLWDRYEWPENEDEVENDPIASALIQLDGWFDDAEQELANTAEFNRFWNIVKNTNTELYSAKGFKQAVLLQLSDER